MSIIHPLLRSARHIQRPSLLSSVRFLSTSNLYATSPGCQAKVGVATQSVSLPLSSWGQLGDVGLESKGNGLRKIDGKWWGGLEAWLRRIEGKDGGKEDEGGKVEGSNEGEKKGVDGGSGEGGRGSGGGDSGKDGDGKGGGDGDWKKQFWSKDPMFWFKISLASAVFAMVTSQFLISPSLFGREISFQEFTYELLERGLVDRLEIVNRTTALVYLKNGSDEGDIERRVGVKRSDKEMEYGGSGDNHRRFGDRGVADDRWDRESGGGASDIVSQAARMAASGDSRYPAFRFNIGEVDAFERKLEQVQEDMDLTPAEFIPVNYLSSTSPLSYISPSLILVILMMFMVRTSLQNVMGRSTPSIFHIGKAKTGTVSPKTTFAEVAGLGEAKNEILEFVEFLKKPEKFRKLGAKIPRGALLVGPPGTGKTLLAKATAGEAGVPFFSISGSEFIEMFVGVGPSRVRDLFTQARNASPSIIFIDEIDAIGRSRGGRGGFGGGNDERENTLNALLVEMDGFSTTENVVVLAGTNRADILDRALLRPGRFDRQIAVEKPDIRGRYEILMVHLAGIKVSADPSHSPEDVVNIKKELAKKIASYTPGMSGADLANVCNEAALVAARRSGDRVLIEDFESAVDRVIGGLEKKNRIVSARDREIVAHHEAGHAVAGWHLKHGDPLLKVSIIPRGNAALGFAQYLPQDRVLQNENQMRDFMIMALGGRVAESLIYGAKSVTTGAQDDLQRVTRLAYAQVSNFGMNDKVGKIYYPRSGEQSGSSQFYKPYGEETAEMIDAGASDLVNKAYAACEELLRVRIREVKTLAQRLLEKEVVREKDLVELLGPRKHSKPADYDTFVTTFDKDRRQRTGQDGNSVDPHTTPAIPINEESKGDNEEVGDTQKHDAPHGRREESSDEEIIPDLA